MPAPDPANKPETLEAVLDRVVKGETPFYVTTPIFYVNDAPHIGHAYATILADVLARYHRLFGDATYFLTGTDEHGQKVERAAAKRGTTPQAHADEYVQRFQELWPRLLVSNNDFIRTTQADHVRTVQTALQKVFDAGDIYQAEYRGYYHVADETFVTADKVNPAEIESGEVVELAEKNYFFRLSKYQDWLIQYIKDHPDFILPEARRNWVLGHLREPLADLCISRPKERFSWGIELPFDKDFVCYVWFDALVNYVTGIEWDFGKSATEQRPGTIELWTNTTHVIGKDILQHHGIYWPIMLYALGLPQPAHILATGWWIGESGDKISKRQGGSLAWLWLADKYGPDALRYFLLREMVLGNDSAISEELFLQRYNAELANGLGNLLSRVVKIAERSCGGKVPPGPTLASGSVENIESFQLLLGAERLCNNVQTHIRESATHVALSKIAEYMREIDRYIDEVQPWKLAKDPTQIERLGGVLRVSMEAIAIAAGLLSPVIPQKAAEVFAALGGTRSIDSLRITDLKLGLVLKDNACIQLSGSLFQRADPAKVLYGPPDAANDALAASKSVEKKPAPAAPKAAKGAKTDDVDGAGLISIDDFGKVVLRTAVIAEAAPIDGSDRLLRLQVDLGDERRQLVAGIAKYYAPAALIGKRVLIVANLQPATIFGLESQGMVLAAKQGKKLTLLTTDDAEFPGGARAS